MSLELELECKCIVKSPRPCNLSHSTKQNFSSCFITKKTECKLKVLCAFHKANYTLFVWFVLWSALKKPYYLIGKYFNERPLSNDAFYVRNMSRYIYQSLTIVTWIKGCDWGHTIRRKELIRDILNMKLHLYCFSPLQPQPFKIEYCVRHNAIFLPAFSKDLQKKKICQVVS